MERIESPELAKLLRTLPGHAEGGLAVCEDGKVVGVLLTKDAYENLKVSEDLVMDPGRFHQLYEAHLKFQAGEKDDRERISVKELLADY